MDKRKRMKRVPRPTGTAFDLESLDLASLEKRVAMFTSDAAKRQWGKSATAHAAKYSGPAFAFNKIMPSIAAIRGREIRSMIIDELTTIDWPNKFDLTEDEHRWAVAFRITMGVNKHFYESKPAERRREIEAKFEADAGKNSLAGKRAAKVLAHRVQSILSDGRRIYADGPDVDFYRRNLWEYMEKPK